MSFDVSVFPAIMARKPDPSSLAEMAYRLMLLRRGLDKSQSEMGRLAGVSGNAWYNYESGIRRIDLDAAMRLEDSLSVPQEWIYRGVSLRMPSELGFRIESARRAIERELKANKG
jgi:transcriptional regulator with XRE-family HTH domain